MKKYLFLVSALLLTACGTKDVSNMSDSKVESLISYEAPDIPYKLKLERNPLFKNKEKTIAQFQWNSAECGTATADGYFESLVDKYENSVSAQYGFEYSGEGQGVSTFWVTVLPNIAGYTNMEEFKADFDVCNPNRGKFPYDLNKNWLMLVGSCGADFDDETDRPYGCRIISDAVQQSLKLAEE